MIDKTKLKTILTEIIDSCTSARYRDECIDIDVDDAELDDWVNKFSDMDIYHTLVTDTELSTIKYRLIEIFKDCNFLRPEDGRIVIDLKDDKLKKWLHVLRGLV